MRRTAAKFFAAAWLPALIALTYAGWDFQTTAASQQTVAGFVKTFGTAFFFIMYFVGQWLRAAKQIADDEQKGTLHGMSELLHQMSGELAKAREHRLPVETSTQTFQETVAEDESVQRVLDEFSKSRKGALLILGAEIERKIRHLLGATGWTATVGPNATITRSVDHLVSIGALQPNLANSVRAFLEIRSRVLHGRGATEDDILKAIDTGLDLLRALLVVPAEEHRVLYCNLDMFADLQGTNPLSDQKAIIVETTSPDKASKRIGVFATTRSNLRPGQRVSWEWDLSRNLPSAFFINPDIGGAMQQSPGSLDFVGRELDSL